MAINGNLLQLKWLFNGHLIALHVPGCFCAAQMFGIAAFGSGYNCTGHFVPCRFGMHHHSSVTELIISANSICVIVLIAGLSRLLTLRFG